MEELSTAIRESIAGHGLTIAVAAKRLEIGRHTFSRKHNGHADFSISELTRLVGILDTTVADLMQRADQIANALAAPDDPSGGLAIQDKASEPIILQVRRVDWDGGESS